MRSSGPTEKTRWNELDAEMTRGVGGSGLGLYISREIVTQMDGTLTVSMPARAMTDVGEIHFMPRLVEYCARLAPHVGISSVRASAVDWQQQMEAGRIDLALGAFWKPADTTGSGSVHWLVPGADRRQPWQVTNLDPEPTVHRMRCRPK